MSDRQMQVKRRRQGAWAVTMLLGATASVHAADRFNWTIDATSAVTTKLTATYSGFSASDSKTANVTGTFGGLLGLPAYDFESVLLNEANVGYVTNPTFNLSFGQFFGGVNVTTNGLGFAIPGANNKSYVPTTPAPVDLTGAFDQTGTGVEGRGTLTYAGYGTFGSGVGSGTIALVDLSPIPGELTGTLKQVGNQIRLTTPLALDQSTTLSNGVTVRAQISGNVTATATTTAGGWLSDAGGSMANAASWSSGVVPTFGTSIDTAVLGNVITAPRTLTNAPFVRRLVISSAVPYTIDSRTPIGQSGNSSVAGHLDVLKGTGHTINSLAIVANTAFINIAEGAALSATFANGHAVTKTGDGLFIATNGTFDSLAITGGTVRLNGPSFSLDGDVSPTLSVSGTGKLDIAKSALRIQASVASLNARLTELRDELRDGYSNGTWTGPGVVSSAIGGNTKLGIGYASAPNTLGEVITAKLVLNGDADLDGAVDFDDLIALAKRYNQSAYWSGGDFNYDGSATFNDLLALAKNYNQTYSSASAESFDATFASDWALAQSMVPEPTSMLGIVGVLFAASRRGSRRSRG